MLRSYRSQRSFPFSVKYDWSIFLGLHTNLRQPHAAHKPNSLTNRNQFNIVFLFVFEQEMQDKMLRDSAGADGDDFMAELEELCRDDGDATMSTIS